MYFSFFQPCAVHPARMVVTVYETTSAHVLKDILGRAVRKVSGVILTHFWRSELNRNWF